MSRTTTDSDFDRIVVGKRYEFDGEAYKRWHNPAGLPKFKLPAASRVTASYIQNGEHIVWLRGKNWAQAHVPARFLGKEVEG